MARCVIYVEIVMVAEKESRDNYDSVWDGLQPGKLYRLLKPLGVFRTSAFDSLSAGKSGLLLTKATPDCTLPANHIFLCVQASKFYPGTVLLLSEDGKFWGAAKTTVWWGTNTIMIHVEKIHT